MEKKQELLDSKIKAIEHQLDVPKQSTRNAPLTEAQRFTSVGNVSFVNRESLETPVTQKRSFLPKGVRVRHPKYGEGTIQAREGNGEEAKVTVNFERHGLKRLVEKFAQLERIDI